MARCDWDEAKRRSNVVKHGIDFADACRIFDGPVVEFPDIDHGDDEPRLAAYGQVDGRVLFVVFTWRRGRRRIISARKAGRHGEATYWQYLRGTAP